VAIQINIADDKIDNLSTDAQTTLKKQMEKYADDIIKEANLVEEAIREDGASTEITSNIILLAVRRNRNHSNKKSNKGLLFFKIVSALSLLITGFLFDENGYQDNIIRLVAFIIVFAIACVTTVLQFVFEERE
jgi:cell division protein FtsB